MTVFTKDTTYGLETRIKELQEYLNSKLPAFWSGDLEIYGIAFPLQKRDSIVLEAYKGDGAKKTEYKEIFINDKIAATIGFIVQERSTIPYRSANVDVVFTLLIPSIYPDDTERNQEKALLQAEKIIESWGGIGQVEGVKEGVLDVFSGFDTEKIKYRDMHPWYVFSLNINIEYTDDSCQ